ncbi:MAG: hypothetical protein NUV56_04575 [Candidatus Uhrbacteria bacterium]|nr:hypothetical protein [Candidatus Uhrbacteria bacterium]
MENVMQTLNQTRRGILTVRAARDIDRPELARKVVTFTLANGMLAGYLTADNIKYRGEFIAVTILINSERIHHGIRLLPDTTALSLSSAFATHEEAVRKAKETWENFCHVLLLLIPSSLNAYAAEREWKRFEEPEHALLFPEWLKHLVTETQAGSYLMSKYPSDDLANYDFTSLKDAERKMTKLKKAWKDVIEMKIWIEPGMLCVKWRAV